MHSQLRQGTAVRRLPTARTQSPHCMAQMLWGRNSCTQVAAALERQVIVPNLPLGALSYRRVQMPDAGSFANMVSSAPRVFCLIFKGGKIQGKRKQLLFLLSKILISITKISFPLPIIWLVGFQLGRDQGYVQNE